LKVELEMKYLNNLDNRGVLERIDQIEGQDGSSRSKQRLRARVSRVLPPAMIPNASQAATNRERAGTTLGAVNQAVVGVNGEGAIALCPDAARNYLAWHFNRNLDVGDCLPPELSDWLTKQECAKGARISGLRPFTTQREGRLLTIHLLSGQTTRYRLLLLEEKQVQFSAAVLKSHFGLSARRAEVLLWLAQGKTNNQIAVILGLSTSTIHKHTERVFDKLGVESRTAAARQAARVMGKAS
jgi:DNA-binding CsgD family transcriptional regulator